jgi:hypothetical protein
LSGILRRQGKDSGFLIIALTVGFGCVVTASSRQKRLRRIGCISIALAADVLCVVNKMSEYINKQALLNEIEEWNIVSFYELNEHSAEAYRDIKNAVKAMPSIDIVFCKDCKRLYFTGECILYGKHRKPDDYCSKGETYDD